jgi:hypothetical protein
MWPKQEKAVAEILKKMHKQRKDLRNLCGAEDANTENNGNDRSRAPKDLAERVNTFNSSMAGFLDIRTNNANRSLPPLFGLCINAPPCACKLSLSLSMRRVRVAHTITQALFFFSSLTTGPMTYKKSKELSIPNKLVKRRIKEGARIMKEQARTANDARDEVHQTEGNSLKRKNFTAAQLRMNGAAENTDDTDGDSTEVEARATDDEFRPSVEQPEFAVPNPEDFPSMPVRTGRGSLSELMMRVFVKLLAKCTVSVENSRTIFVHLEDAVGVANDVFGQHWTLKSTFTSPSVARGKKRRAAIDLTHRFPGNQAVASWMKAARIMSLRRLALHLTNREEGTVETLGGDATTKAVGHKLHDVHTMSLTLTPLDGKKEVFTTGFQENAGHKGEDQAKVMTTSLECLGILCGMPVDEKLR